MEPIQLTPHLSVGPQIAADDLSRLAREGFTDIVCNRPDTEHPEDPDAADMSRRAADLGLAFHYLPITHGEPFEAQAEAMAGIAARPGAKVFAYCRSGARSSNAWALAETL